MILISKEQIIKYHCEIINDTGGTDGLRDDGMAVSFEDNVPKVRISCKHLYYRHLNYLYILLK